MTRGDVPREITEPLGIDPDTWDPQDMYFLMNALVVPRPIAWVSTQDSAGRLNLAPHSYFTPVSYEPPMLCFTSLGRKDTIVNLEQVGEFVVNVASREFLEPMNVSAAAMPADENEFEWAGLETVASQTVSVPSVAGVPARLECRLEEIVSKGNGLVVFGTVTHIEVSERIWSGGRVDVGALDPLCRLAGSEYAVLGERIKRPRPKWTDLSGGQP